MFKKLLLSIAIFSFVIAPASAQSFYADISYQSFQPYINFSIQLGNDNYYRNTYDQSYLKGYMDGVNQVYYDDYRFYELVHDIRAYEAGYKDGLRDQALLSRLRGYQQLSYRPFSYDDYYSPYYSVQIWLNELSFTFIKAPSNRLPRYWSRHLHPRVKYYRSRVHNDRRFYSSFEKKYKNYNKRVRKQARDYQKRYRTNNRTYRTRSRPAKLDRARAIKRVRSTPQRSTVRNRSVNRSRTVRSRPSRTYNSKTTRSSGVKSRSTLPTRVRSRSTGSKSKVQRKRSTPRKVKSSRGTGKVKSRSRSKTKSRGKVKRSRSRKSTPKKVESRRKSSNKSRGKVKRSRSRSSKGKKSKRGGSRKRGGN